MLWISGPPRSGTTMMNLILSGPDYAPECTIVTEFIRLYSICKNDPDPRYQMYMGSGAVLRSSFVETLKIATRQLPDTAVLKDPNICLYTNEWRDLFPQDRMVVVIRDPRDVVSSMLTVLRRKNPNADVSSAIEAVAPHFFQIEKCAVGVRDIFVIRYEDVVLGAKQALTALTSFVGHELALTYES